MDTYKIDKISNNDRVLNSLNGTWGKSQVQTNVRLTIVKDILFIISDIVTSDTVIDIALPEHLAFYVQTISLTGININIIEANKNLAMTIPNGSSIIAQTYLK
jgi:hypothetical protein